MCALCIHTDTHGENLFLSRAKQSIGNNFTLRYEFVSIMQLFLKLHLLKDYFILLLNSKVFKTLWADEIVCQSFVEEEERKKSDEQNYDF